MVFQAAGHLANPVREQRGCERVPVQTAIPTAVELELHEPAFVDSSAGAEPEGLPHRAKLPRSGWLAETASTSSVIVERRTLSHARHPSRWNQCSRCEPFGFSRKYK